MRSVAQVRHPSKGENPLRSTQVTIAYSVGQVLLEWNSNGEFKSSAYCRQQDLDGRGVALQCRLHQGAPAILVFGIDVGGPGGRE